ncbi:DapH/DapD/GlmU-related protein [uncultured Cellulomonas sp.]|uniref:acyltransferase n=1 Tax=uncultured Cellulomonas sp. TaxID=189682 RepID=UPI00260EA9E9|nr:acyltransferase [uncultured Cellulomonas sp.]
MATLTAYLNERISRIKGAEYRIDPRIDAGYLTSVVLERGLMRVRGRLRFPLRAQPPFVGAGVRVRCRRRLRLGAGVTLGHGSLIDALSTHGVTLGDNTSVGRNTRIECTGSLRSIGKGLRVGRDVGLGTDSLYGCAGGISIGDDTIIGNFVSFHSENHRIDDRRTPIRLQGVTHAGITVGSDCWIGARVTVLDGAHIGDGCVIAAGTVVTAGEYPSGGIYGGVPARLLKNRD